VNIFFLLKEDHPLRLTKSKKKTQISLSNHDKIIHESNVDLERGNQHAPQIYFFTLT
jgi:hypothetical protein